MFPIKDTIRSRKFPIVNTALIAVNVLVFLFEEILPPQTLESLFLYLGLVPARLSLFNPLSWITLFTSVFLHGGWFHLISNIWTLYIFGDNVEDRMGSGRYLLYYLLAGAAAGLAQVFFLPDSSMPTIGASGAIAGVLGAYFILYPAAKVVTLIPVFIFPWFIDIPAFIYLGIWFVTQLSSGLISLGAVSDFGGVAWWAHIGGFVFGFLTVRLFSRKERTYRRIYNDEY
ncbi:MAG: rhomboid family intramembrane serine protease [Anaerolineales bacterium]|nr:rhomboid family intramembrane serine protease [Anaerolineales bacterium]